MNKQTVKEIAMKHNLVHETQNDRYSDDVYAFADELLCRVRHGHKLMNMRKASILSDALHLIQIGVRYKHDKDLEHGLELLRSTRDELCAIPKYHDDVELVGTKQVEFNITGVPDLPRKDSVHSVPYYPIDDLVKHETDDLINPNHYKTGSGVECIDIAELFPYSLGNAIKYAWRAGKKDNLKQDLEKCAWYLERALANGEDYLLMQQNSAYSRARWLFNKLDSDDLPEMNYIIINRMFYGRLENALTYVEDCIKGELDDET